MSRNQIINSNSVQSQFALLVRDKESLHKQSTNADNERRHEESQLQNLRYLQSTLSEKIRVAHANLGVQSKKKQMLNTEMKRLKKVLEDDRNAIEELVVRVEQLEEQNIERKFQFVKEMDGLNEELADALRMYEEKGLEKMLKSVGSCHAIEHFLSEKIQQDNLPQDQHWNSIYHSISDVVGRLEQNIQNLDNNKRNYVSLCEKAQQLRQKVETKHSKSLGRMELDELESLWEQNNGDSALERSSTEADSHSIHQHQQKHHPVNMHLFYGNELNTNMVHHPTNASNVQDYDYTVENHSDAMIEINHSVRMTQGMGMNKYGAQ